MLQKSSKKAEKSRLEAGMGEKLARKCLRDHIISAFGGLFGAFFHRFLAGNVFESGFFMGNHGQQSAGNSYNKDADGDRVFSHGYDFCPL